MTETHLDRIGEQLLRAADRIHKSAILTNAHMKAADTLLWAAYEAGAFPRDDLFTYIINEHRREQLDSTGFCEVVLIKWLPVRVPGAQPFCAGDDTEKDAAEHGIRQIARMLIRQRTPPTVESASDNRQWTGPTTQAAIAAKFKVKDRTVRRWVNGETKGPVAVRKDGSMFYYRPRQE